MLKRFLSLALIAMMMALFIIPAAVTADNEWTMYVYTDNGKSLNVRSDPMTGNNVIGSLNYGDAVSVRMTTANGWTVIDWYNGTVAYVQSRFLVAYKPASKGKTPVENNTATDAGQVLNTMNAEFRTGVRVSPYTVIARPSRASGWVNLRWGGALEAERITTCGQGKRLTVLAELRNWYQVQDPESGMIGFISRKFVSRK